MAQATFKPGTSWAVAVNLFATVLCYTDRSLTVLFNWSGNILKKVALNNATASQVLWGGGSDNLQAVQLFRPRERGSCKLILLWVLKTLRLRGSPPTFLGNQMESVPPFRVAIWMCLFCNSAKPLTAKANMELVLALCSHDEKTLKYDWLKLIFHFKPLWY